MNYILASKSLESFLRNVFSTFPHLGSYKPQKTYLQESFLFSMITFLKKFISFSHQRERKRAETGTLDRFLPGHNILLPTGVLADLGHEPEAFPYLISIMQWSPTACAKDYILKVKIPEAFVLLAQTGVGCTQEASASFLFPS